MVKSILISAIILMICGRLELTAQEIKPFSEIEVLNRYIEEGFENNLALKQKHFSYQQSVKSLKEARGMFLPSVGIDARYSRAGGGRIIDFPVGDMLNNVYLTLNNMLEAQGQGRPFLENLPNEQINFLREEEHDTKIRAVQPIFQPAIYYNYKIKSKLKNVSELEVNVYKRQLAAEIKTAYFNYLKTVQVERLLKETKQLLKENLRVSQKLFESEKATKEIVYRAQTELSKIEQQITESQKYSILAQSHFNFLLNRPLQEKIEKENNLNVEKISDTNFDAAAALSLKNREELKQLEKATEIAGHSKGLAASAFLPGISLAADYGFQGEEYKFDSENDYWMVSGVLQWNLFNGFQDQAKKQRAAIEEKKYQTQLQETRNLIQLQVQEAVNNLKVAQKQIITAKDRVNSARQTFKLINKKYEQGMSAQIEYLDARNSLTNAEINLILSQYDYLIKNAEVERITASIQLN